MKVLIAEDENVSRRMLQKTLEKWGYEVVSTANGVEAFGAFQQNDFSMVITDWMMPEMDGVQLVEKIRNADNRDYVYIIMLTANSKKEDLVVGMNAGADDFVAKPFDKGELHVRLRAGERVINLEKNLFVRNQELERINQRMKLDLTAAAEIQKSLLPSRPPQVPGISIGWEFRPCDELAGDILNVFQLDEHHLAFYVLDVSGHGVPAALLAVSLSRMLSPEIDSASLLKTRGADYQPRITPPAEVTTQLNRRFQMSPENGQFFTMLYGIIDLRTKELRYSSAGHPGIILTSRNGEGRILKVPSLPIGFLDENIYEEHTVQLQSGDRIFMYSDGLPEAEDPADNLFGMDRMVKYLKDYNAMNIKESISMLLVEVNMWANGPLKDDVTLLGIEIHE